MFLNLAVRAPSLTGRFVGGNSGYRFRHIAFCLLHSTTRMTLPLRPQRNLKQNPLPPIVFYFFFLVLFCFLIFGVIHRYMWSKPSVYIHTGMSRLGPSRYVRPKQTRKLIVSLTASWTKYSCFCFFHADDLIYGFRSLEKWSFFSKDLSHFPPLWTSSILPSALTPGRSSRIHQYIPVPIEFPFLRNKDCIIASWPSAVTSTIAASWKRSEFTILQVTIRLGWMGAACNTCGYLKKSSRPPTEPSRFQHPSCSPPQVHATSPSLVHKVKYTNMAKWTIATIGVNISFLQRNESAGNSATSIVRTIKLPCF